MQRPQRRHTLKPRGGETIEFKMKISEGLGVATAKVLSFERTINLAQLISEELYFKKSKGGGAESIPKVDRRQLRRYGKVEVEFDLCPRREFLDKRWKKYFGVFSTRCLSTFSGEQ